MQRWTALIFAICVLGALSLAFVAHGDKAAAPAPSASASAGHSGPSVGSSDAGAALALSDAGAPSVEEPSLGLDSPHEPANDAGGTLLNGEPLPAIAAEAPKSVTFGVVLVQYRGAQGAPGTARTREAALDLAKQLAVDAKDDFKAAVAKGDKGSNENMGRISRGFLEPAPEFVLFSLAKDAVSDPVDTPRGFWIVKRIE